MREITAIMDPPRAHWVGDGFPVRSLISPATHARAASPFLLLDHAGPHAFAPADAPRGVAEHPHRGFETVTIVYDGELEHRDSAGNSGRIGKGDVQWMTAASGVLHEEFHSQAFTRNGGTLEMAQLWINLPAKDKMAAPGYQTLRAADIPAVILANGAGIVRVVAGSFEGRHGPARTFTPIEVLDIRLAEGGAHDFALPEGHTVTLAVLKGDVRVNGASAAASGQLVLFARTGGTIRLEAASAATVLLLSGEPIDEPIAAHGPFVMNTVGEIKQALIDFEGGRFGAMARAS